jgi:hypothetical protein
MGFRIDELMSGYHRFHDGAGPSGKHPFAFRVTWGPDRLRDWINPLSDRFMWQELSGEVQVGGLSTAWAPCTGTLELLYHQRRIRYVFDANVEGRHLRYVGEKVNISPINLPFSHTTCFGTLTEQGTGRLLSTSVVTFKLRHLPGFLLTARRAA